MNIKTVFKNISSLVVIEVVNQLSLLILAILLPRYLGDIGFGQYSFVMSFTLLLNIFLDLGLRSLTIREVSRDETLVQKYLSNITLLKSGLAVITFLMIVILANIIGYPLEIKIALYIMGISIILNSYSEMFRSIFYAYQKMEFGAITLTSGKIVITLLVAVFLFWGYGLVEVMLAFLVGNLFSLLLNYRIYIKNFPKPVLRFDFNFSKYLIISGLPFGLAIAFNTIFFNFDIVMISTYLNSAITGWYSVPVYVLTVLITFFYTVSAAIFPAFSKFHKTSQDLLGDTYQKTFRYLLIFTLPIPPLLFLLANSIIPYVFGQEFYNSIFIFQVLIWLLIPITLARFMEMVLAAINRQITVTYVLGVFAMLNIILDIALIPVIGYMGAIIATIISQIFVFILDLYFISKYLKNPVTHYVQKFGVILVIIGTISYILMDINPIISIMIIIGLYLILLIALKCVRKEDVDILRSIFP